MKYLFTRNIFKTKENGTISCTHFNVVVSTVLRKRVRQVTVTVVERILARFIFIVNS
jgi:hypothetical protein